MSADDFGRSERTVIRPNPGGRRPTPQPTPAAPQPAPAPQASLSGQTDSDQWFRGAPASPSPPAAEPPRESVSRSVPVAGHENVLLEAAQPLLLLLGRLRASLAHAKFASLMEQVSRAVEDFERRLQSAGLRPEQAKAAKYILCATADDIVQNIPNEERQVWTQYSMLSRFFGERTGGVRFFDELDRAKSDPLNNYDQLELQYACLALGFQGVHRTSSGGQQMLQQTQRNLYEILRRVRPRAAEAWSPNWPGQTLPLAAASIRIPLWAVAAAVAALLLVLFLTLRFLLASSSDAVAEEIGRLVSSEPLALQRRVAVAPAPPVQARRSTQLERIRAALASEIGAQQVDASANAANIVIRIGTFASFQSGEAKVLESFRPVAAKIGAALDKEPGYIKIIGHTDNVRLATAKFESNFALSLERAQAVSRLLAEVVKGRDRLLVEGKGADAPISSNETNEGRARNRRVEILIPRDDI
jgi:type VI secretion system protein ImpK